MRSPGTSYSAVLVGFLLASTTGSASIEDKAEDTVQRRFLADTDDPRCQDCQPSQRPQCNVFYAKCASALASNSSAPSTLLNGYFAPTCDSAFCSGPGTSQQLKPSRLRPGDICESCVIQGYQREEQCIEEYTNCVAANLPGNVSSCIDIAQTFAAFLCGPPENVAPGPLPEKIQPLPNVRDLPSASPSPSSSPKSHISLMLSALEDDLSPSSDLPPIAAQPIPASLPAALPPAGRRLLLAHPGSDEKAMPPLPDDLEPPAPAPAPQDDFPLADDMMLVKLPVSIHGDEVQKLLPDVAQYGKTLRPPVNINGVQAPPRGRRLLSINSEEGIAPDPKF
ncbi:hypothetical protein WJX74_009479 [Apatococcus lobatus]|uniref:Extracellular membrane protein CFEM domain-containing protein n=1 Tax=Apatococcus lobatus TaxID=904363 RepID=A0AAW1SAJ6_9CHLO